MSAPDGIRFASDYQLSVDEFVDILQRSGLLPRRPVTNPGVAEAMLRGADIVVTAWDGELLVGISRAISDFVFCTYLSDLAVDETYQHRGIGRELVRQTHELGGLNGKLILLAAPAAEAYYPKIGMQKHASCWLYEGH